MKLLAPRLLTDAGILTDASAVQPAKVLAAIESGAPAMVAERSEVHPLKAPSPMLLTEAGSATLCSAAQSAMAREPMEVTVAGISTDLILRPARAPSAIAVSP